MPGVLDMSPAPTQAPFSILGLLLGGRSYAGNYFAQRDALTQQANERARIGQAAQGLLASPEYKTVFADPERQAAGALWARMQPDFSAMGNNLLSQKIGSIYQGQSQQQAAQIQEQQTRLSDQLERERMGINVDNQLKIDQIQRDRNQADTQNQYKYLLGLQGGIGTTALLDKFGIHPGQDRLFGVNNDTGMLQEQVIRGSNTWNEGIDKLSGQKDSAEALSTLSDMASGKVPFDQGLWNATRLSVVENVMKGKGTYDKGLKDFLNELVPDKSYTSTDWLGTKKSQLAIQAQLYAARAQQLAKNWGYNLDEIPSVQSLSGLKPTTPPPSQSPLAASRFISGPGRRPSGAPQPSDAAITFQRRLQSLTTPGKPVTNEDIWNRASRGR